MNFKKIIDKAEIAERVKVLSGEINQEYRGEEITVLCVLKGSLLFTADLVRNIDADLDIEFMRISSYVGTNREEITSLGDLDFKVEGKKILVVEDIVDSGNSINFIVNELNKQNPESIKIVTLLYKPDAYNFDMKIDWIGFNIKNDFVVGYGMDYNQKLRNRKSIYKVITDE